MMPFEGIARNFKLFSLLVPFPLARSLINMPEMYHRLFVSSFDHS